MSLTCDRLREELKRIEGDIQREKAGANNQQVLALLEQEFNGALKEFREQGCDALPPPPPFVVRWEQAGSLSILIDAGQNAWNAGHINDVLILSGGGDAGAILVASDGGGVWILQQPNSSERPLARPLSDHWGLPSVNIKCLESGPDGSNHVYAGSFTSSGIGFVFEADPSAPFPLKSWRNISGGKFFGNVYRIIVLKKARRIVIACDRGLRWADIPSPGGQYSWQEPLNFPQELCSDVTLSKNDSVVTARPLTGPFNPFTTGLFRGHWTSAGLEMQSKPLPINPESLFPTEALMGFTTLASCESDLNRVYALLGSSGKGAVLEVFRSDDGGDSWTECDMTVQTGSEVKFLVEVAGTGNKESYNNCITVSPINPEIVALGWRGGPILSDSGGKRAWLLPTNNDTSPHLHADLHAVRFDATGRRLYVCSDGGVVATDDFGRNYNSLYNRELLNLQFYGETHGQSGSFSASAEVEGLIAGGTQDNGNIYTVIGPNAIEWRQTDGGDGGRNLLVGPGRFLRSYNTEPRIRAEHWVPNELVPDIGSNCVYTDGDGKEQKPDSVVPVTAPKPPTTTDACGLANPLMVDIRSPKFSRRFRDMIALAAVGTDVYGLFTNWVLCFMQSRRPLLHWDYLGSIDSRFGDISALASVDGNGIFVGTTQGAMFAMAAPRFIANEISVSYPKFPDPSFKPVIKRIAVLSDFEAFAIYNTKDFVGGTIGHILRFTGHNWFEVVATDLSPISRLNAFANPLNALEADWTTVPLTLFVCTDRVVVMSDDLGQTWHDASKGLPQQPNCTDLRFVRYDDGSHYLYLSTYGRSIWRARMNRRTL
jgi:hypothetical protein